MRYYKKTLLLFVFCCAMLSTKAAKPDIVTDTVIKITVDRHDEIFHRPIYIQITQKYGKIKIAYNIVDSLNKDAFFNDPDYGKFVERTHDLAKKRLRDTSFISEGPVLSLKHGFSQRDTIETQILD